MVTNSKVGRRSFCISFQKNFNFGFTIVILFFIFYFHHLIFLFFEWEYCISFRQQKRSITAKIVTFLLPKHRVPEINALN